MHEYETSGEKGVFLTLTYDDAHLPSDLGLHKRDLQLFFKRLRSDLQYEGRNVKIKYFACGEYGDNTKRPHYHAIVFGLDSSDSLFSNSKVTKRGLSCILDSWRYGFTFVGTVTWDSIQYVTGYVEKKWNGKKALEEYGEKEAPFQLQSAGIGLNYIKKHREQLIEQDGFYMHGSLHSLPPYYQKKLGVQKTIYEQIDLVKEAMQDDFDDRELCKLNYTNCLERDRQKEKNVLAHEKLFTREVL